MEFRRNAGTLAVHAGLPRPAEPGTPLLPSPSFAAPFHFAGPDLPGAGEYGYGRANNPSWTAYEAAIGELEGGHALAFASGMAAMSAALLPLLRRGDVLVAPHDGYPGVRELAADQLEPAGIEVRLVATDTEQYLAALDGARVVWVESPSNPRLDVCDLRRVGEAARRAGAFLMVDNTVATPLGQRCLDLGADLVMTSGTKSLAGHSDLVLGVLAARDPALLDAPLVWRTQVGAIPSAFEAWLAHRSLATLDLRLERQSANAAALVQALRARDDVTEVVHPSDHPVAHEQMRRFGPLVGFTVDSAERAQAVLAACELVSEATSFGGVHSTAERRGRWGTDAVDDGFIRLSAGCEDAQDLVADVLAALDATAR